MTKKAILDLFTRLAIHRDNLAHYLKQAAYAGGERNATVQLINNIRLERGEISNIKQALRRLGAEVIDEPDDDPLQLQTAPPTQLALHQRREATLVHLITVADQALDAEPDETLDWREYFTGSEARRDHQLTNPADWNMRLLPEIYALEARIKKATPLMRVRGLARLSVWFAFGYIFAEVARYTLEVEQQKQLWRTDAPRSHDFSLVATNDDGSGRGEMLDGQGTTVAVGISVNRPIDQQVCDYLKERSEPVAALLLLRTEPQYLRSAGDATALADLAKRHISTFVDRWRAHRLLFFYVGPLSGACFIGHRMNAVCREIQLMEHMNPGYTPSFLLR